MGQIGWACLVGSAKKLLKFASQMNYTEGERIASNFQKKGPIVAVDEIITKEGEDEVDDIG